jgi:hypothetical protein
MEATSVPGGAHLRVELGGEAVALHRGERTIVLRPVERAEIDIVGPVLRDLHGRAIHTDQALLLRARWPRADVGGEEPIEAAHEVLVEVAGQALPAVPVSEGGMPEEVIEVGPRLRGSASVLRRVVFKLVRRGERRALARAAGFVWVGLQPPLHSAFAGRRPANLVAFGCAHLDLREDRVALPADIPYAAARLMVDDVDGRGRRETFEFAYPGTLAMLRWIDRDGVRREQILDKAAIVVIRPGDARLLEVSAPDPAATLIVGTKAHPRAFANRARVGIPLTTVAEACRGGADRLVVRGADRSEIALARFTVPCDVDPWVESSESARDERSLLLGFREPLDQLRVRARDLWHGRPTTIELGPDGLCRRAPTGITLRLQPDYSGPGSRARLIAELQDWPDGLWLCELDARLGDDLRWHPLCNTAVTPLLG